ncbi:MAG: EAL domain-containing protein [Azonexus sp.]|nr:EAL domain-containing protein [Azonexus sp.]
MLPTPHSGRFPAAKAAIANLPQGIGVFDAHLQLCQWDHGLGALLLLAASDLQVGLGSADLFHLTILRGAFSPADGETLCHQLRELTERQQPLLIEQTRADGHTLHIRSVPMAGGGCVLICTDITERRANARDGQLSLKMFLHAPDGIIFTDGAHRIVANNPATEQLTGQESSTLTDCSVFGLIHPAHSGLLTGLHQHLTERGGWDGEFEVIHKSGDKVPVSARVARVDDQQTGQPSNYIWLLADISERRHAEAEMRHITRHDTLTGLINRKTLVTHLTELLPEARRHQQHLAVLLVDLDHFKLINDALGHRIGDEVLLQVAHRLARLFRESDYIARFGGDEFVLILPAINAPADAAVVANKIIGALAAPFVVEEHELHTSPSIGIALFPSDGDDGDTLLKNADAAMYHAKAVGRNNFQFFASEMNRMTSERLDIERKLRRAVAHDELSLHFQPQFAASGELTGVEALLRWLHPTDGMIAPDRFIPVAEETGIIVEIGEWALQSACRQMRQWLDDGLPPLRMAVNVSARQLRRHDFSETVANALAATSLPPALLELEITESAAMENPHHVITILQQLNRMGVTLAIDDFGTGYSSLAYLKLFPIDRLKIDRSFVADIEHDLNDRAIAFGAIALAHSLNLKVIAEGVETESQHDLLRSNGCDEIQGYLLSKPLPSAAAFDFLHARSPARPLNG